MTTGRDSLCKKCSSDMLFNRVEHVLSENYETSRYKAEKTSTMRKIHHRGRKRRIIDSHTQTEFSSDESSEESKSELNVPKADLEQIEYNNCLKRTAHDLYFCPKDKNIQGYHLSINNYENPVDTENSVCSIESDKLSSDPSDHQFDYDYQNPSENYLQAYERKTSSNSSINFEKIERVMNRNKQTLKLIEEKNLRYSQGKTANSFTANKTMSGPDAGFRGAQAARKSSPKLSDNLRQSIKKQVTSVSYDNVPEARNNRNDVALSQRKSPKKDRKEMKKIRSKTSAESQRKKQEHERLMQEIKFRLEEKRRISEELQRKIERKQRQEQRMEEKRIRLEAEKLKRHLKVHTNAFYQPHGAPASGDNKRKRSISVLRGKSPPTVMLPVEKSTSIQSFLTGSDVQTQTEVGTASKENKCLELKPSKQMKPFAACGEFFTVIQNDDGTFSMGDQDLKLQDKRVSDFLTSYKTTSTALPSLSMIMDTAAQKPSPERADVMKKPKVTLNKNRQKRSPLSIKQLTNKPKAKGSYFMKPVTGTVESRKIEAKTKLNRLGDLVLVPKMRGDAEIVRPRTAPRTAAATSRTCEITIKRDVRSQETQCKVTFEAESGPHQMDICEDSDDSMLRILPIMDRWSMVPITAEPKCNIETLAIKRAIRPVKEMTKFDSDNSSITIFTEPREMQSYIFDQDNPYKLNKAKIKRLARVKSCLVKRNLAQKSSRPKTCREKSLKISSKIPQNRKVTRMKIVRQPMRRRPRVISTIFKILKDYEIKVFKCFDDTKRRFLECEAGCVLRQTILFTIYASTFIVVFSALRMTPPVCLKPEWNIESVMDM